MKKVSAYYYNSAQSYKQFFLVGRLYRALISFGLALFSERLCVFGLHGAFILSSPFNELSLVLLANEPPARIAVSERCFSHYTLRIWNSLPMTVRSADSNDSFKARLDSSL